LDFDFSTFYFDQIIQKKTYFWLITDILLLSLKSNKTYIQSCQRESIIWRRIQL